ncbi:DNA repair protein RecN [Denitrificimonas sp. JX-1]|uniref:DNA repair protein RecN n=1 Tax=Denitrificimonas halotolerans TaxID=3098930 RepID=A0ABU5GRP5_9GAMM|nr:DNA repair protein RecN [Denitrificimonas sp. JX-1]MDY7219469.1 DNA repair protein RecN [Denitrificimonas sp. JX-1]
MLVHISVKNYAIVDHLDLELHEGMSVITGETGAGKSIMLDALSLTLGARTDSSVIRPGADKADILSSFDVTHIPEAQQWLKERDLDNDAQCILRRVITREGRSRGYINGTPCPLADLKALGEILIDIHSQHEHQSLLKTDTHRRLLDEFAGATELTRAVQSLAQRWRATQQKIEQLSASEEEQRARRQLLTYQLEELEMLSLGENELAHIEQEHKSLSNSESILDSCRQIIDACSENDNANVLSTLASLLQRAQSLSGAPQAFTQATDLLSSAHIQIEEAISEFNHFAATFEADPQRQLWIEERLDAIYTLARKHRVQPEQLHALQNQLANELAALDAEDANLEHLQHAADLLLKEYSEKAQALSKRRASSAKKLTQAVMQQLQMLGMPDGQFSIALLPSKNDSPALQGLENVEFLVSANPGQPLRGLAKVASGGELSRISLAIQVITAQTSRVPTLVFDEVDVGIGGPTAEIVGQLLRQLGENGQVLTVTHLPQVAAQGHQHLFVHKERQKKSTHTAVKTLTFEQRVEEVARMLGGIDLTDESLQHARKILDSAQALPAKRA